MFKKVKTRPGATNTETGNATAPHANIGPVCPSIVPHRAGKGKE